MSPEVTAVREELMRESDVLKPMGIQGQRTRYANMRRVANRTAASAHGVYNGPVVDYGGEGQQVAAALAYLVHEISGTWNLVLRTTNDGAGNNPSAAVRTIVLNAASELADIIRFASTHHRYWQMVITRQSAAQTDALVMQAFMSRIGAENAELT